LKKILLAFLFSIIINSNSLAGYGDGFGELNFSQKTANSFINYITGNTVDIYSKNRTNSKPWLFLVTKDGTFSKLIGCSYGSDYCNDPTTHQWLLRCKDEAKQECFIFAEKNKIVWNNKEIYVKSDKREEIIEILKNEKFYKEANITKKPLINSDPNKDASKSSDDIVIKLQKLNDLYKSGAISEKEFKAAKNMLLN
jgi:hypothetical protein